MRITARDVVICSNICKLDALVTPAQAASASTVTSTITITSANAAPAARPAGTTATALPPRPTRQRATKTKRVRWGTVTALEFGVGHNACCVPASAGPPIGLVGSPIRYTVSSVPPESSSSSPSSSLHGASSSKSRRQDLWLCPMERVEILQQEAGLSLDAITEICSSVSAVLDARAFSKLDHVAHRILESLELSRYEDLRKLRATFHQDNRKKVVLF